MTDLVFDFLAPFGGSGGQSLGILAEEVRLLGHRARFRCRGSIDSDRLACEDYERFTGSRAWPLDVMAIEAFWSAPMFRAAFGERAPHLVIMSPPCKGASRLLSSKKARTAPYRQLNRLAVVWCSAMLEAWGDDPPALILLENVPGLPHRARAALRSLRSLLRAAGYIFHASTHDCGEIGGLAQHRERYLLVARHPKKCPPLLYQPPKKRVRAIGEVLSELPVPATPEAVRWGELHTMPRLSWRNWLRLALIPAGGDWRDLDGVLQGRARREVFRRHAVADWTQPIDAITGPGGHSVEAIADPRAREVDWNAGAYGVRSWGEPSGAVTGGADNPSRGAFSVADPRVSLAITCVERPGAHGVLGWEQTSGAVVGSSKIDNRPVSVADPRLAALRVPTAHDAGYGVVAWGAPARTVAGTVAAGTGAYAVADPRDRSACIDVRALSLDEAMALDLDAKKPPPFVPVIVAEDGSWHRPLTLLELARLQSFPAEMHGEPIRFAGSRTTIATHVGNAIPADAARAIARVCLVALTEAALGAWSLSSGAVWVRPSTSAMALQGDL